LDQTLLALFSLLRLSDPQGGVNFGFPL